MVTLLIVVNERHGSLIATIFQALSQAKLMFPFS